MRLKTSLKLTAFALIVSVLVPSTFGAKPKKKSSSPPVACSKKCKTGEMCIVSSGKDTCMKAKPDCAKPGATPTSIKSKVVTCSAPKSSPKNSKSKGKPKAEEPPPAQDAGASDIAPADPKEVEMITGGLKSIIAMYPGGQQMCPSPMPACGTYPPLPDPVEVMENAKAAIEHGKPEAVPPCLPLGKPGDATTRDEMCLRYPNFCVLLPSPPAKFFAAFTEPFPCFLLTRPMFQIVEAAKAVSPTTFEKCMWDYAICFLYACYPGMNPTIIATSILQGKITVPSSVVDKMPEPVRKAYEQSKAMSGSMPSFG